MNTVIIKRYISKISPDFLSLIFYSKHTAVYKIIDDKWNHLDILGTLVVYTTKSGNLNVCVFNKSNLNDFKYLNVQSVVKQEELIVIDREYGLWFSNENKLNEAYKAIITNL